MYHHKQCEFLEILEHRRYIISNILSFLGESDGTSICISNKKWSRQILPFFEVNEFVSLIETRDATEKENTLENKLKKRHHFRLLPVQDSLFLLEKLNTRRLARRIRYASKQLKSVDTLLPMSELYPQNMNTEEIAWREWTESRANCGSNRHYVWPTKLQLLRYRSPPANSIHSFVHTNLERNINDSTPPKILPKATVLASYPRSGNTLLRTILERVTGIVTGSDTRPDRTLSKSLSLNHDLVGEGVTNHLLTPIIKTHFPERRGYMTYNAERIILLVRNPFDAIDSYWNMCATNTHTESVTDEIYMKYIDKFRGLAKYEFGTWLQFHKYWLVRTCTQFAPSEELGPPILIVRFEDLIQHMEETMQDILKFITGTHHTHELHNFWKYRIRIGLGLSTHSDDKKVLDTANLGSYKPRALGKNVTSSIGKSLKKNRYNQEDLDFMHELAKQKVIHHSVEGDTNILKLFGYDVFDQGFPVNMEANIAPMNFYDLCRYGGVTDRNTPTKVAPRVNSGSELRPTMSPYGRLMTNWRKSQTDDDKNPFPTTF
jgi:hypothetical protein